jgi:hypothetical protein
MASNKKVEPKATAKKTDKKTEADKDRKQNRKTQGRSWSDATIKHAVTRLG